MKSIREIYKIGKGPSSSHTMGPERAAESATALIESSGKPWLPCQPKSFFPMMFFLTPIPIPWIWWP